MKSFTYNFECKKPLAQLAHITKYSYLPVSLVAPISKKMITLIRKGMGGKSRDVSGGRVAVAKHVVKGYREYIDVFCYQKKTDIVQPAIVFFHGGGWIGGSVKAVEHFCMALADQTGVAVFSVDYHLAPEYPFPCGLEDSYQAVTWIAKNAKLLNIDAKRISVAGDSAGGNFATVICLLATQRKAFNPYSQILLYPVVDVTKSKNDAIDLAAALYLKDRILRNDWRVSPILSECLKVLPRTLIAVGERDALYHSNLAYAELLDQASVDTTLMIFSSTHHAFIDDTGTNQQATFLVTQISNWLNQPLL